ncbi:MAG: WG repeat-containing protein [Candidatus Melainabacteria bacterium]|nr:WG repeat-containing protein [Candidatus Melainabacteria bacterium]
MNLLIPVLICTASALVSSLVVYFLVFPRVPGFSLNKHKVIGGLLFAPLQGITTAIGFGAALYAATLTSVITALGGGVAAVPIIFTVVIGGTTVIFFVANFILIYLYKTLGIFEISAKFAIPLGVCALMGAQLIGCIISVVCCFKMFTPDNTYSFIDKTGKVVIDKKFSAANAFKNGKAQVTIISDIDDVHKYIDHKGNFVSPPSAPDPEVKYKLDDDPNLYEDDGRWSLGRYQIVSHELELMPFSEGLAAARPLKDRSFWGFVDSSFQFQVPPTKFLDVRHFTEGLAPVCIEDESPEHKRWWGYIDKTGKILIEPKFHTAACFSEGLAKVSIIDSKDPNKTLVGFIDKTGNFVIQPQYAEATSFSEGVAAVRK